MHLTAGVERRQQPRYRVEVEAYLACADKPSEHHIFSIQDISLSGMALSSATAEPQVGDTLCLCLSENRENCSPDHIIEATVMHRHNGIIGVCFNSVGIHVLKDIHRLLREGRRF